MDRSDPELKVHVYTAEWLMEQDFGAVHWTIEDLLPEGLLVFVARSKVGKTWLAMGAAVAVSSGGSLLGYHKATAGAALYLDLDQRHPRRTQRRIQRILRGDQQPSTRFHLANEWPRFNEGGIEALEAWVENCADDPRLIVIDTAGVVWPQKLDAGANAYYAEYAMLDRVRRLAASRPGLCIALVHHESKAERVDVLDRISGTAAWAAAADTLWLLGKDRETDSYELFITGKEIEEQKIPLVFDWQVGGFIEAKPGPREAREWYR